jgi:hypothetical protein
MNRIWKRIGSSDKSVFESPKWRHTSTSLIGGAAIWNKPLLLVEQRGRVVDTRIRKVVSSYLGPDTTYPDCVLSWFSSAHPYTFQDSNLN